MVVGKSSIAGTLKYVEDYEFEYENLDGHFLLLKIDSTAFIEAYGEEYSVYVSITESEQSRYEFNSVSPDGTLMFFVEDVELQKVVVELKLDVDGNMENEELIATKSYDLSGLVLEAAPLPEPIEFDLVVTPVAQNVELFGANVSAMQMTDLTITPADDVADTGVYEVTGTLAYMHEFTGYPGGVEHQVGNFMALTFEPTPDDAEFTLLCIYDEDEQINAVVAPNDECQAVFRIASVDDIIEVLVFKDDQSRTFTLDLTGLTLTPSS